jgi:spore maturation protein CgeD
MAKGKLITYATDDVLYLPHKLKTMVDFLRRNPKVRVCYNRQKQELAGEKEFMILSPDRVLKDPFCRVDHNSVMHYKSCIKKVGKWDTGPKNIYAFADAVFWRKLTKEYLFYPIREVLEINLIHKKSFSHKLAENKLTTNKNGEQKG